MTDEMQRPTDLGRPFLVYKVVRYTRRGGRPRWCSTFALGDGRVCYAVDEPAVAPAWLRNDGYHLLVYDTLARAAEHWRGHHPRTRFAVFEADGEGAVPLPAHGVLTGLQKKRLWPHATRLAWWPPGSVMVQRLTLRRRIPAEVLRVG
jgi:hypothetical protein